MASDVGGVVGGVMGHDESVGEEVYDSSKLSPLVDHEPGPMGDECLCHPKLTLKGEAALWLL